jgi:hypothetical protein
MSIDIDKALERLASAPTHPGLAAMDQAVLARIAQSRKDKEGQQLRLGVLAGVVAVAMGAAGSSVAFPSRPPAPLLAPFAPNSPFAPSTLLAEPR